MFEELCSSIVVYNSSTTDYLSQSSAGQLKNEISALTEANQQLQELKSNVTAQKESLESENIQLLKNQTLLHEILQFRNFPVEKYCSKERTCSRCPSGWRVYNSKCYYVSLSQQWKTWEESRLECFRMRAYRLTIQNKEEQMFIKDLAPRYYDKWHSYWIRLTRQAQHWVWVDRSLLTTGFWADVGSQSDTHVLTNTGHEHKALNTWRSVGPDMRNRWICENKALLL